MKRSIVFIKPGMLLIAGALLGCPSISGPSDSADKVFSPGQAFTLDLGQTGRTADSSLVVAFTAVPEDSRCAPDLVCVWEGFAKVRLSVESDEGNGEVLLSTNPTICCTADTLESYQYRLIDLAPVPLSTDENPRHTATLMIVRDPSD